MSITWAEYIRGMTATRGLCEAWEAIMEKHTARLAFKCFDTCGKGLGFDLLVGIYAA